MHRVISLLAAGLLAAACSTPEQRAAAMLADMDRMTTTYGPACARLGYAANSDPWRNCVLELSAKEDYERYGINARFSRGYWGMGGRWGSRW